MKKVLCGLVIALMMTGNVYAKQLSDEECGYLLEGAKDYSILSKKAFDDTNKENEDKYIERAYIYAVTWSAMCKD